MILNYLIMNKDRAVHVSDIIAYMEKEKCTVNKTTVYRYLDKLAAEKMLMKYVADKGEKAGYQYVEQNSKCQEHLHLQCMSCGRVIHLDCDFMGEISNHIYYRNMDLNSAVKIRFYMDCVMHAVLKKAYDRKENTNSKRKNIHKTDNKNTKCRIYKIHETLSS